MDWEAIVNDIISNKAEKESTQREEVDAYIRMIARSSDGLAIGHEIQHRFDSVVATYARLSRIAETEDISWSDEDKFDTDLYAAMIFSAYYLQKAWSTVADAPTPLPIARVIGYALIVGYRLGVAGGQPDDL